jgi:hypothetical protein
MTKAAISPQRAREEPLWSVATQVAHSRLAIQAFRETSCHAHTRVLKDLSVEDTMRVVQNSAVPDAWTTTMTIRKMLCMNTVLTEDLFVVDLQVQSTAEGESSTFRGENMDFEGGIRCTEEESQSIPREMCCTEKGSTMAGVNIVVDRQYSFTPQGTTR